jgi:hypothetical protein
MPTRTVKSSATFRHPFTLKGMEEELPAGDYNLEIDEELLEEPSFPVFRRTRILLHLQKNKIRPNVTETVWVNPTDFDAALARDRAK